MAVAVSGAVSAVDLLLCPCNMKTVGVRYNSRTITCCSCNIKWHVRCVGLNGMSSKEASKYTEWRCPSCFVMPIGDNKSQVLEPSLHEKVQSEIMKVLPLLVTTVVKETEKHTARTYASVTKETQESLIMDCFEKSSATVVAKEWRKSRTTLLNGIAESAISSFEMYRSVRRFLRSDGENTTRRKCKIYLSYKNLGV